VRSKSISGSLWAIFKRVRSKSISGSLWAIFKRVRSKSISGSLWANFERTPGKNDIGNIQMNSWLLARMLLRMFYFIFAQIIYRKIKNAREKCFLYARNKFF
jgi:hypothetical protein